MKVQSSLCCGDGSRGSSGGSICLGEALRAALWRSCSGFPTPPSAIPPKWFSFRLLFSVSEVLLQVLNGSFSSHLRLHQAWLNVSWYFCLTSFLPLQGLTMALRSVHSEQPHFWRGSYQLPFWTHCCWLVLYLTEFNRKGRFKSTSHQRSCIPLSMCSQPAADLTGRHTHLPLYCIPTPKIVCLFSTFV